MEKVKLIYNPISGEGVIANYLDTIISIYQKRGYTLVPYRLLFDESSEQGILFDLDSKYHHILIAGGDGTVNYVVNILKKAGIDIPIALLPAGTANDFSSLVNKFARKDIENICKGILSGEVCDIDLGLVNGEYFVNVLSCGLFVDISHKTPTIMKNTFGKLAYYASGIGELPKFKRMHISINSDAGTYDGSSLVFFVFNGRTAGNLQLARSALLDDGLLDVVIIKGDNPIETMQTIFYYIYSRGKTIPQGMIYMQCSKLTAQCSASEATDIDGQVGPRFPLDISCEKGALRVIMPKKRAKK